MTTISETELARIVDGILEDRESIIKHNPIGTEEEILLWMLLAILSSYLNLSEQETPCFTGKPDANTYSEAIRFVLRDRKQGRFDDEQYLAKLKNR
ncbi:MAG TPA: hypothetical protein VL501_05760 [Pyrinomonadaceae bacterium]|nr:hypothetical protein [Pyrinomonadaceae bacterium]